MLFDDEEAYDYGHITCHMIWDHRPRLWEKGLKEYQSTYIEHSVLMKDMRLIYGKSMDNTWTLG